MSGLVETSVIKKGGKIMAENKLENLSRFAVNLNERAAQGKLDPVIGFHSY